MEQANTAGRCAEGCPCTKFTPNPWKSEICSNCYHPHFAYNQEARDSKRSSDISDQKSGLTFPKMVTLCKKYLLGTKCFFQGNIPPKKEKAVRTDCKNILEAPEEIALFYEDSFNIKGIMSSKSFTEIGQLVNKECFFFTFKCIYWKGSDNTFQQLQWTDIDPGSIVVNKKSITISSRKISYEIPLASCSKDFMMNLKNLMHDIVETKQGNPSSRPASPPPTREKSPTIGSSTVTSPERQSDANLDEKPTREQYFTGTDVYLRVKFSANSLVKYKTFKFDAGILVKDAIEKIRVQPFLMKHVGDFGLYVSSEKMWLDPEMPLNNYKGLQFLKHIEFREKSEEITDAEPDLIPVKRRDDSNGTIPSSNNPLSSSSSGEAQSQSMPVFPMSPTSGGANNTVIEKQKKQIESLERQVLELQQQLMDFQILMDESTKELETSSKRFQEARVALKKEQESQIQLHVVIQERDEVIQNQALEIEQLKMQLKQFQEKPQQQQQPIGRTASVVLAPKEQIQATRVSTMNMSSPPPSYQSISRTSSMSGPAPVLTPAPAPTPTPAPTPIKPETKAPVTRTEDDLFGEVDEILASLSRHHEGKKYF